MKSRATLLLLGAVGLAVVPFSEVAVAQTRTPFMVYDNMFYRGKPNTTAAGLVVSNIIYENKIWPNEKDYGRLPNRSAFAALVRAHKENPGPLVIDIEKMPLKGPADVAHHNAQTLATLADWAHEAAPGKVIGFYGTNTLSKVPPENLSYARELARHVDASSRRFIPLTMIAMPTRSEPRIPLQRRDPSIPKNRSTFICGRSITMARPSSFSSSMCPTGSFNWKRPFASATASYCGARAATTGTTPPAGGRRPASFCTPRAPNCNDQGERLVLP
jgi:hypothetical protein